MIQFKALTTVLLMLVLSIAGTAPAFPASRSATEGLFQKWLADELWPEAKSAGISRNTFNAAFSGVSINWNLPGLIPPGSEKQVPKEQHQAEFSAPARYFSKGTLNAVVAGGRARAQKYQSLLDAIERKYGVPRRIILAIWGRESGFGGVSIPHNAFSVLATKAFMSTRPEMFRGELLAALKILQEGDVPSSGFKSSWAGALGQPQFMPTSFLRHAVDFDGDGRRDIWNSVPDTLASIANYLDHSGWQAGRDWGYEVVVPPSVSCALEGPDQGKRIADWQDLGVRRVNGKAFPTNELNSEGYLMMPAGSYGPAFIVTPNFYVLKAYNESDLYALFVGHAADRIQWGDKDFFAPWRPVDQLYRSDIARMQRALEKEGFDVGGADGLPGYKTRRSIGTWQSRHGSSATCFPDSNLVRLIR